MNITTSVLLSIAAMLLAGFVFARLFSLIRLPAVTAYILAGILIGPHGLRLVPAEVITGTDFLPDIALAFIAFGVGEFFTFSSLKKNGWRVVAITLFESLTASAVIFLATYFVLHLSLAFCVVLAALASATAPASTIMTIRQTKAKGELVDTLLQVVALDDVVGLVAYSVAISIALSAMAAGAGAEGGSRFSLVVLPIFKNLAALGIGAGAGVLLHFAMLRVRTKDNRLICALALLFLFCGLCSLLEVSPLLGCMVIGTVYVNLGDPHKLFTSVRRFSAPVLLLFFVRSGMSFALDTLFSAKSAVNGVPLMTIGVVYFLLRILGKYAGAWLGSLLTGASANVRRYLGLGLIPQAGVAIGLAAMCARLLGPGIGGQLQTIILLSSVLYELIGPTCGKLSLYLSHSYEAGEKEAPVSRPFCKHGSAA